MAVIKRVKSAGFCMGVKRAIDIVMGLIQKEKGPIYTDGPLIHNPQIIEMLEEKGVVTLGSRNPCGGLVVIRAHGVSPVRRKELEKMRVRLHDATCPNVSKVQKIVRTFTGKGYGIVIVGDRGHAEVEGLLGYAGGRGMVVSAPEEARLLPHMEKVCVVAQTTQETKIFQAVAKLIRKAMPGAEVFDTICLSTKKRQSETIALAGRMEAMFVVGGRNSANTARLAKICASEGAAVFHVESEKEIASFPVGSYSRVGVTAGASTPPWVIDRVISGLERLYSGGWLGPAGADWK